MRSFRLHVVVFILSVVVQGGLEAQVSLTGPLQAACGGAVEGGIHVSWVAGWNTLHPGGLEAGFVGLEPGILHAFEMVPDCPGDLNGDGLVSTADLLVLLSAFGSVATGPVDFNGDGIVGTGDLLVFLGLFGGDCGS